MPLLGETAGLAAAACWSVTSLIFTYAVSRLGSLSLNLARLTLGALILTGIALATQGTGVLTGTRLQDLALLALSGWIGLTMGDWGYFRSMHLLGPRLSTLLMALAPPMTVALGLAFLGEKPGLPALLGMALTLGGIAWVVLERPEGEAPAGHRIRGVVFGALGSLGQAVGLILSKQGMSGGIGTLAASSVRMIAGAAGMWVIAMVARRATGFGPLRGDRRLQLATLAATILGPVAGIWLSLIALRHTQAGIASTLMATVPILVLPLVVFVRKERVSPRAVLGAVVAVGGVALLLLRK
jgi:drug/metabolite transporter (DMT)-like permease